MMPIDKPVGPCGCPAGAEIARLRAEALAERERIAPQEEALRLAHRMRKVCVIAAAVRAGRVS